MIDKNVVARIVNEWLEDKDYFLVDLTISPDDKILVDEEDYELEVGSAGIGQPFKVLRQYQVHVGNDVEVMDNNGKKWVGTLADANEDNFTITMEVKVRLEGAKRPKLVEQNVTFAYDEIKYTKYLISFK